MNNDHEFLWKVLEGAIGEEKVAYLRHAPLHTIVLNKMAQDYPEQDIPDYLPLPQAAAHIAEKHAFASRRWKMVEDGIDSLRELRGQGLYKRSHLLPKGCLERKLAVRARIVGMQGGEDHEKVATVLAEYDKQLAAYLGPERTKLAGKAGLLDDVGSSLSSAYKAVKKDPTGKAALKGLGYAGGAALPAGAVGYGLVEHAEDKAKGMLPGVALAAGAGTLIGGAGAGLGSALGNTLGRNVRPQR